jgi:peptidoglycan/xylan/chitin deacetylase (PgdA/CDA1 family)
MPHADHAPCWLPTGGVRAKSHPLNSFLLVALTSMNVSATTHSRHEQTCNKPVYLTFDTGHMAVAPLIADVLRQENVRVTFFAAHERTQQGDGSLGDHWAPWWRARAAEGHMFASHTMTTPTGGPTCQRLQVPVCSFACAPAQARRPGKMP